MLLQREAFIWTDSKTVLLFLFLGICKLINNGSYIAAFPPHEVISIGGKKFLMLIVDTSFILFIYF